MGMCIPGRAAILTLVLQFFGALAANAQYWPELIIPAPVGVTASGEFGAALDVEGDWLLAGAPGTDLEANSSGAAYLFNRNEGGANAWELVEQLVPPISYPDARFGEKVQVADGRAFIAAPGDLNLGVATGAVYVYERDLGGADNWGFKQKIVVDQVQNSLGFGQRFLASGDQLFVNCPGYDENVNDAYPGVGGCAIFQRNPSGLYDQIRFVRGDSLVNSTQRPALSGWFARFQDKLYCGSRSLTTFRVPLEPLLQSDADIPAPERIQLADTFGYNAADFRYFGAVANNERLLLDVHHGNGAIAPHVVSFVDDGSGSLTQQGYMMPDSTQLSIEWWGWGEGMDLLGDRAVIGAYGDVFFTPNGHAEVYAPSADPMARWERLAYLVPSDPHYGDQFGRAVAMGDGMVAIGAPFYGELDLGEVYVYMDPFAGIDQKMRGPEWSIAPNPCSLSASGSVHVHVNADIQGSLTLRDTHGCLVREQRAHAGTVFPLAGLSVGAYLFTWSPSDPRQRSSSRWIILLP